MANKSLHVKNNYNAESKLGKAKIKRAKGKDLL